MKHPKTIKLSFVAAAAVLLVQSLVLTLPATRQPLRIPDVEYVQTVPSTQPTAPSATAPAPTPAPQVATKPVPSPTPLPEETHPVYPYTALMNPTGTLYTMEPFWPRLSATNGWNTIANINGAPVIAVIDTGFALSHQDLVSRFTAGWDFIHNDNSPNAGQTNANGASVFHGTMTAGLAGLINPNTRIMPLQALDDDGSGNTNTVAAAVRYAADHGASVISLSLGSVYDDAYLRAQIDYAISKGVLVVAAAGNSGCDCLSYPAAYPEVLSVGATDGHDNRASFSSFGANLDVVAPGVATDVCSTTYLANNPTSAYTCSYSGTSFATPLVAGLAGLLLNQAPSASPDDLTRWITQGADKTAAMSGQSRTTQLGYGRMNIYNSVVAASLTLPTGQLASKRSISLSSTDPNTSPAMDTACVGVAGSVCTISLVGPSNQIVGLGSQTLDENGSAEFTWNAATLGLVTGQWQVKATLSAYGQTTSRQVDTITISP